MYEAHHNAVQDMTEYIRIPQASDRPWMEVIPIDWCSDGSYKWQKKENSCSWAASPPVNIILKKNLEGQLFQVFDNYPDPLLSTIIISVEKVIDEACNFSRVRFHSIITHATLQKRNTMRGCSKMSPPAWITRKKERHQQTQNIVLAENPDGYLGNSTTMHSNGRRL